MSMEKNAIEIYTRRAGEAQDPDEKALYSWLAKWEGEHLAFLSRLDREITEQIWNDNNFWPF
jgi:rubrerythrin